MYSAQDKCSLFYFLLYGRCVPGGIHGLPGVGGLTQPLLYLNLFDVCSTFPVHFYIIVVLYLSSCYLGQVCVVWEVSSLHRCYLCCLACV